MKRYFKTLFVLVLIAGATACWAKAPQVKHAPQQPKSGEPVQITAETTSKAAAANYLLEYQVVEPGKYIALKDPEFQRGWTSLKMQESSLSADQSGRHRFVVQIPGEVQKHRRLVRYRIRSATDNQVIAPDKDDAEPNFAYFVYDGLPSWKGAINPNGTDERLRQTATYSRDMLERVPVTTSSAARPR